MRIAAGNNSESPRAITRTACTISSAVLASGGDAIALISLQSFGKVLAGLVLGLVTLMLLTERRQALAGRPTG